MILLNHSSEQVQEILVLRLVQSRDAVEPVAPVGVDVLSDFVLNRRVGRNAVEIGGEESLLGGQQVEELGNVFVGEIGVHQLHVELNLRWVAHVELLELLAELLDVFGHDRPEEVMARLVLVVDVVEQLLHLGFSQFVHR